MNDWPTLAGLAVSYHSSLDIPVVLREIRTNLSNHVLPKRVALYLGQGTLQKLWKLNHLLSHRWPFAKIFNMSVSG